MSGGSDVILDRLTALHPKKIDLTLGRVERLLAALGHPERRIPPVIHVAGTNGKGSTVAMIRAGLEAAGKRVHVYTSPHLARFHERIRVAGALIEEPALAALLEECEAVNAGEPITFFEITTAAAFLAYAREPADYTLLEVGLGGRLDATNVVTPRLSIITPVSFDHQQYLGETLAAIAGEKAGILKRGVPAVIAPQPEEAMAVIERQAARVGAPLHVAGQHWNAAEERGRLVFVDETGLLDLPRPALRGPHQIENGGTAVAALRLLGYGEAEATAGMERASWPARMQRLREGPLVDIAGGVPLWLDGGHNPAGGLAVAGTLRAMGGRWSLVCGMLNTKDPEGFLRPLAPLARRLEAVSIPEETATLTAAETAEASRRAGIDTGEAENVAAAVRRLAAEDPGGSILICGSLYLAGHVLREHR